MRAICKKNQKTRLVAKLSQLAVKRYRAALICNGVNVKAKQWYTTWGILVPRVFNSEYFQRYYNRILTLSFVFLFRLMTGVCACSQWSLTTETVSQSVARINYSTLWPITPEIHVTAKIFDCRRDERHKQLLVYVYISFVLLGYSAIDVVSVVVNN